MKNKRLSSVKRILDRNAIKYDVRDYVIVTEPKDEQIMKDIAHRVAKYVSHNSIIFNIRRCGPHFVDECSLEIDTGTERDTILRALDGVEYQENYGYFTTPYGEVYITDDLGVMPETSLYSLICTEERLVDKINNLIDGIRTMNEVLRRVDKNSSRHKDEMSRRQGYIDDLEIQQGRLSEVRKELREKLSADARTFESSVVCS